MVIDRLKNIIKRITLQEFFLIGFLFFLPINENINTWFLIGFFISSIYLLRTEGFKKNIKKWKYLILISSLLFFMKLIGILNASSFILGLNETVRSSTFIVLPFSFLLLSLKSKNNYTGFFYNTLLIGTLVAITICWTNSISAVIRNNEPLLNLIAWKRSNLYLTKIIDIHPTYLGIIVATCILFINLDKTFWASSNRKFLKLFLNVFLILFLLNLTARNSIIFLTFIFLFISIIKYKWKSLLLFTGIIILFFSLINNEQTNFVNRKYIKMLNINDELMDKRFSRLEASIDIFRNHPIFGAGMGNDDKLRIEYYKNHGYKQAYLKQHNAHNQYIEYLSTFGFFGLLILLYILFYYLNLSFQNKQTLTFVLLMLFSFACLTESILERELGIKYFSMIVGILYYNINYKVLK